MWTEDDLEIVTEAIGFIAIAALEQHDSPRIEPLAPCDGTQATQGNAKRIQPRACDFRFFESAVAVTDDGRRCILCGLGQDGAVVPEPIGHGGLLATSRRRQSIGSSPTLYLLFFS